MTAARLALSFHRFAALVLCLFALPHLVGHLSGLWGPASFDAMLERLRPLYRHPLVEPILIGLFVLQAALGLWLAWRQLRRGLRGWRQRLQCASGVVLSLFLLQHLFALFLTRWGFGLQTGYWWPGAVAGSWPFALYFWPYYLMGVSAFFLHLAIALWLVLRRRGLARPAELVFWAVAGAGVVLAMLILAGISGLLHDQALPTEWQAYLASFLP